MLRGLVFITMLLVSVVGWSEPIEVHDDLGRLLTLSGPARRVVSLAPHITETLFAAGAGDTLVGAVSYSDYPAEAKNIPRVGGYRNVNLEMVAALQPDLIVAWRSGNGMGQIQPFIDMGFQVYIANPQKLEDIATSLRQFGQLTGHPQTAAVESDKFLKELARLRVRYSHREPVTTFYQVWNDPLQTLNGTHVISEVINLCGGRNVFADSITMVPHVNIEALLLANPEVIIASGMGESRPAWLDAWRNWPSLQAAEKEQLYFIPPNHVQRHAPRILLGARQMCEQLEQARSRKR